MSKREDITAKIHELLKAQRTAKLGVVSRDPIVPEELPRTGFPSVHVESSDEERELSSANMQEVTMETNLVVTVNGKDRDTQRNIIVDAIETTINGSSELSDLVTDIRVSRLENIINGEAAPYSSIRVVLESRYCINL
jgi:hypothetical protein